MSEVKDIKSMVAPVIGVIGLAVGNVVGLSKTEIDTVTGVVDSVITVAFSIVGLWGIWKSHIKKPKVSEVVADVKEVAKEVVTNPAVIKEVEAVLSPADKPAVAPEEAAKQ